ncbi:RhoGAP-domain-containing protein [Multifurca ochricompacta]|uniref:RhoGAP-domain-containing protein n=1 Tax=Multifurca ochricompacta TaxID=376703 RepID=A0AAD4QHA9_9AGAM|nr:RhoGAP-domain-containing protein [Multifurca ochricompacta]
MSTRITDDLVASSSTDSHGVVGSPTATHPSHPFQSQSHPTQPAIPASASNLPNVSIPSRPSLSSKSSSSPRDLAQKLIWRANLPPRQPPDGRSDVTSVNQTESISVVEPSFDENVLRALCELDCGVPLLLDRIKQSMVSCREASVFFKKRAVLEEEFGRGMQKLAKNTAEVYAMNDGKAGSFVNAWQTTMKIHEIIAENRLRFASRLNEMSEELANLAKEVDKNRKATKELATRYERNLQESEVTTEKSKARLDTTMEELGRILLQKEGEPTKDSVIQARTQAGGKRAIGKAVAKGGLLLKGKNPGNIQRQEDDIRARVQASSQAYHKSVQETQGLRQEYFNFQLPRILRALKECADEIDLGTQYHLTRYAFLFESIVLSDGSTLAPTGIEDGPGLKPTIESIDNRSDFKVYMQNYAYAHGGVQRGPRRTGPEHEGFLPPLPQHVDRMNPTPHSANTPSSSHSQLPDRSRPTFGVDLAEQMARDGVDVPPIVVKCCEAIEKYGITTVGIYRIGGTMSKVTRLKEKLDKDLDSTNLDAEEWSGDISNVTSVLKLWLRELPEPLLTMQLHQGFLDAAKIENDRLRHIRLHERVNDLPDANYAMLKYFLGHLHKIVRCETQNAMSIGNLAIIFGPTLFPPTVPNGVNGQDGLAGATIQNKAIETILEHYTDIFVDESEVS